MWTLEIPVFFFESDLLSNSRWVRAIGPSFLYLLPAVPSSITKQLSSSRERPSCSGQGSESRGVRPESAPGHVWEMDWHAPFLLQVFLFSLGLCCELGVEARGRV